MGELTREEIEGAREAVTGMISCVGNMAEPGMPLPTPPPQPEAEEGPFQ